MNIVVKVKTGARKDIVSYDEENVLYLVSVKARPIRGEANNAVLELLATEFGVPKTSIVLKSGHKSLIKRFQL